MITKCEISATDETIETPDGIIPIMKYKRGAPFDKSSSITWRCAHTLYAYWVKHEPGWLRLFDCPELSKTDFLNWVSNVTCNDTILLTTPLEEGDGYRFDALTDSSACIVVYGDNTVSVCKGNELPSTGQINYVYELYDIRDALPGDVLLTREDRDLFSCYKLEYQFHLQDDLDNDLPALYGYSVGRYPIMISKEFGMPCTAGTVYEDEWGHKYIEPECLNGC